MKIIKKLKEIFNRIFKNDEVLKIDEVIPKNKLKEKNIKEELKTLSSFKLLKLQHEYETGNIKENQISNSKMKELIELYQQQINELDYKLAMKRKLN